MARELFRVGAFEGDVRKPTRHLRVVARVELHPWLPVEPLHPPITEIPQPRRLALRADALMERERFSDRVVIGCRVGADLLELPNVVVHLLGRGHEWPEPADLLFANIEKAGPDRREQPLVQ